MQVKPGTKKNKKRLFKRSFTKFFFSFYPPSPLLDSGARRTPRVHLKLCRLMSEELFPPEPANHMRIGEGPAFFYSSFFFFSSFLVSSSPPRVLTLSHGLFIRSAGERMAGNAGGESLCL